VKQNQYTLTPQTEDKSLNSS